MLPEVADTPAASIFPGLSLTEWLMQTVAMLFTCFFIPKLKVDGPIAAFITVVTLAFINTHLWSTALFFKIPDSASMQLVVLLLANGLIFWIVVKFLPGIEIEGIFPAIAAPVVFSILSILVSQLAPLIDWAVVWKFVVLFFSTLKGYLEANVQ